MAEITFNPISDTFYNFFNNLIWEIKNRTDRIIFDLIANNQLEYYAIVRLISLFNIK